MDGVNTQLRAHEEEKWKYSVVWRLLNEAVNNTFFIPIVMPACGAMGPSMVRKLMHSGGGCHKRKGVLKLKPRSQEKNGLKKNEKEEEMP